MFCKFTLGIKFDDKLENHVLYYGVVFISDISSRRENEGPWTCYLTKTGRSVYYPKDPTPFRSKREAISVLSKNYHVWKRPYGCYKINKKAQ